MARATKRAAGSAAPDTPVQAGSGAAGLAARIGPPMAVAACGAIVFGGALGLHFAQDDFAGLARASGILPPLEGPWRYVSGQLYFDLMRALAGLEPLPYRLASLASHIACGVLLYGLLARRLSRPAAWVGAAFFVAHPALFTGLYSVSGIGEILAVAFALAALRTAGTTGPWRWAAVPLFSLSLLSKESTLLLPAVLALQGLGRASGAARGPTPVPSRAVTAALAVLSVGYVVYFLSRDVFGVRAGLPETAAYSLGGGADAARNLFSYLGWTLNFLLWTVRGFTDAVDPAVFPYGVALLALWLAGLLSRRLRERGWLVAGALYAALLLPVLPLRNHTYHYYLYGPLCGAAWWLAAAWDAFAMPALAGSGTRRLSSSSDARGVRHGAASGLPTAGALLAAAGIAALLTLNGALLVRKIETHPFVYPEMRSDPVVDRARIVRNVHQSLSGADLPPGVTLHFWSPEARGLAAGASSDAGETYWETNVRNALMDGLAVRVLFPGVDSVRFVQELRPVPGSHRYAVYRRTGALRVGTYAELDSVLRREPAP